MEVDRNGLEILDRTECIRLLRTEAIGRIAITSDALPAVLPVNYRVIGDNIVFRTGTGTKLDAATQNAVVAFEVDHIDRTWHGGWSVVVTGVARQVTDPAEMQELETTPVARWVQGDDDHAVAISLDLMSGRRIVAGPKSARR